MVLNPEESEKHRLTVVVSDGAWFIFHFFGVFLSPFLSDVGPGMRAFQGGD